MTDVHFLSSNQILVLHDLLVYTFGGLQGVRSTHLLDSAVAQPQVSFGGQKLHETLASMAAAYFFHLIKNHPFVDGNKRTGVFSTIIFLESNNHFLDLPDQEIFNLALGVATSKISKEELTQIFEVAIRPRILRQAQDER